MLIVLLSWLIISVVFITFGDLLLLAYNRLCKQQEDYSILNLFLLGIPALLIILSIAHLLLPISSLVLVLLITICSIHWLCCKKRLVALLSQLSKASKQFAVYELLVLLVFLLSLLLLTAWGILNYDSASYHYQTLKWIEEFSVVPGLGNIEERIGFNSNYFLLSAPFAMRFLLSEPLFAIQGLLAVFIFIWIFGEVVKSRYSFKTVFLLLAHLLSVMINIIHFTDSSTDVLPNHIVFYLVAYLVIHPHKMKSDCLLLTLLPITILTFKLSLAPFALIALVALIAIIKHKKYRAAIFIVTTCFLLVSLWFTRNAIVSGYLVFPLHEFDFFSFDWKVPKEVAVLERSFIYYGALWQFKNLMNNALTLFTAPSVRLIHTYLILCIYGVLVLSPLYIFFLWIKKSNILKKEYLLLYLIVMLNMVASYLSAPDFRFTYGLVFASLFIVVAILSKHMAGLWQRGKKMRVGFSLVVVLAMILYLNYSLFIIAPSRSGTTEEIQRTILYPRNYDAKKVSEDTELGHMQVQINNDIEIYVSKSTSGFTMYQLPAVPDDVNKPVEWRFQNYTNLQARGYSLQDGFRTKQ